MMRHFSIALLAVTSLLASPSYADSLSKRASTNLVKDFFKAAQQRDEKKLTNLLADNAQIQLTLSKMGQTFSLSKAQYLQQIKSAWHFADNDKYQVSDLKYSLTQAGLLATVNLKLNESRTMFAQNLNIEQNMEIKLMLIDDKAQISAIKSTSNF
ncbi:MAG TPA: hypothetical protein PKU92_12480 [Agitococcus sp.]|nr:hypothetical protein [Agitococcus sp.]